MKRNKPKVGRWLEISTTKSVSGPPTQSSQGNLRAFVRYDGQNKIVPGSVLVRGQVPENGNWVEITYDIRRPIGNERPFILEYTITSPNTTISIPLGGANFTEYNFSVDWGDGEIVEGLVGNSSNLNAQMVHTYAEPGVYEIKILGTFPYMRLFGGTNRARLTDIKQWGTSQWESFEETFRGCTGLTHITSTDAPDMTRFKTQPLNFNIPNAQFLAPRADLWDTFLECTNLTDIDFMANWNISQVRVMAATFRSCSNLTGWSAMQNWDTSNIINMYGFTQGTPITSEDLQYMSNWDMSNTKNLLQLFSGCSSLTNLNGLSNWDVSSVTMMRGLFNNCSSLSNIDGLTNWDVSSVTNMSFLLQSFSTPDVLTNLDALTNWNTSNVTTIERLVQQRTSLTNINGLANWNVSKVTNMLAAFSEVPLDSSINVLNNWDVSNVTTMEFMFDGGGNNSSNNITATSVDLNNWDVSSATNMANIFDDQFFITELGIDQWNIKNVTNFTNAPCQNTTLTTENYDALLIGWASQIPLAYNGTLVFGGSKYTPGGAAEAARAALIADVGAISDGGAATV
jgi:surface protein